MIPGWTGMHSQVPPGSAAAARKPRSPSVGCCARPPAVPALPSRAHTGPHRPVSAEEPSPQSHQEGLASYGSENNSPPYPHSHWYPPHSRRTRVNHRSEEWTGQVSSLDERQLFPTARACHAHVARPPVLRTQVPHCASVLPVSRNLSKSCLDVSSWTQDLPFPTVPGCHHNASNETA